MAKRKPMTEAQPTNEHEAALVALLKDLDMLGVSMVESDWRAMSDDEQNMTHRWVNARKAGGTSTLPSFLEKFATKELKQEFSEYERGQEAARRVTLPCTFLKPAISAKDEDGNRRIKVSVNIPFANLRGGECDRLFRHKECRIEFSARSFDQWDGLPGVEDSLPEVVQVVSDLSGYHASRHFTKIGFLLAESSEFTKDDAFDLEGCTGSIRVEVLGEAKDKKSADDDDSGDEFEPIDGQGTLPGIAAGTGAENSTDDSADQDLFFQVAKSGECFINITLELADQGWTTAVEQEDADGEIPVEGTVGFRASQSEALQARIGQLVDQWSGFVAQDHATPIVKQLKGWLSQLGSGVSPSKIVPF